MPTFQALAALAGRLWNTGNTWARWAIGVMSVWPPLLALVALFGSRALTSTFGLVPLAALVFVLVAWTDPLVIPILAATHFGRTGLQWMSTVLAAELLLGVYFALVPVYNDPGLIPLFFLIVAALGFLSLGAGFHGRRVFQMMLLSVVLIMTVVFIAGGSAAADRAVRGWSSLLFR